MSHHKKRVYPQAQLQYGQAVGQAGSPVLQPSYPSQIQTPVTEQQPQFMTPAQQQLHQQIDQVSQSMGGMQLHNVPVMDPSVYAQAPAQPQVAPAGAYQQQTPVAAPGFNQPVSVGRPMNQLYPIDLLTELPPPITDLSLPPPPLMVQPEKFVVPVETANASPDFVRCTLNAVPKSNSLLKKSKLPLALVIRPCLLYTSRCV